MQKLLYSIMLIMFLTSCNVENKATEKQNVKYQLCLPMIDKTPGDTYLNDPEWFKKNDHCLTAALRLKMEKELFSAVRGISAVYHQSNRNGYKGLTILSPDNVLYKKKLKLYEGKLEKKKIYSAGLFSIPIPSDPNGQYWVLEKGRKGKLRTIVTKRVGPDGTIFSKRIYNCDNNTVKYLESGITLEGMHLSQADPKMGQIPPESIAYYVKSHAC
jgi:hypothetical protein